MLCGMNPTPRPTETAGRDQYDKAELELVLGAVPAASSSYIEVALEPPRRRPFVPPE
jgi:hypothetical protein